MKKLILFFLVINVTSVFSQTANIDITTGKSLSYGDIDHNWSVTPGKPGNPTFVATPPVGSPSNYWTTWPVNICGNWITPDLKISGSNYWPDEIAPGIYNYEFEFDLDFTDCSYQTVTLDFEHVDADNRIDDFLLNSFSLPGNVQSGTYGANLLPYIKDGTNYLEIETQNSAPPGQPTTTHTFSGLIACGQILIEKSCCSTEIPDNLTCQQTISPANSYILSWNDNLSPIDSYHLEINYYAPQCSSNPGQQSTANFFPTGNSFNFVPAYPEFSWRVRAKCSNSSGLGPWSSYECSCAIINTGSGPGLRKKIISEEDAMHIISPNPSNDIFNISTNIEGKSEYVVRDIKGKLVINRSIASKKTFSIDLSKYAEGLYFLTIESKGKSHTYRLLKE